MGKTYYDVVVRTDKAYESEKELFKEWFEGIFHEVKPGIFRGYLNGRHKKSLDLFSAMSATPYDVIILDVENPKASDKISGDWWKSYERRKKEALA